MCINAVTHAVKTEPSYESLVFSQYFNEQAKMKARMVEIDKSLLGYYNFKEKFSCWTPEMRSDVKKLCNEYRELRNQVILDEDLVTLEVKNGKVVRCA